MSLAFALGSSFSLLWTSGQTDQERAPTIFFSDLEGGPNTGGENNKGIYLTLYGKDFGAALGSCNVSVGGGNADNYPIWSAEKDHSGTRCQGAPGSGRGQLHAEQSGGISFTVRPGYVYFVSTKGNDRNRGITLSPWQTLVKATNSMGQGGVTCDIGALQARSAAPVPARDHRTR